MDLAICRGQATVIVQEGEGHYPTALKDRKTIVQSILKNAKTKED
jgi:hypothetical protein